MIQWIKRRYDWLELQLYKSANIPSPQNKQSVTILTHRFLLLFRETTFSSLIVFGSNLDVKLNNLSNCKRFKWFSQSEELEPRDRTNSKKNRWNFNWTEPRLISQDKLTTSSKASRHIGFLIIGFPLVFLASTNERRRTLAVITVSGFPGSEKTHVKNKHSSAV